MDRSCSGCIRDRWRWRAAPGWSSASSLGHIVFGIGVGGSPDACALLVRAEAGALSDAGRTRLASALTAAGFAVAHVELGAAGDARTAVGEVVVAAQDLADRLEAPTLLVGHGSGGAAVLGAAGRLSDVRAVATIGAPAEGSEGSTVEVPLLILHAPLDEMVPVDEARRIFDAARHPKSFVSLDRADHALSDVGDAEFAGSVIASWARRYVAPGRREAWKLAPDDNRVVARTAGGLRTEVQANGHAIVADEPEAVGGTGAGPTPYDLLAAALGACTTMTLRLYADRKGWPLETARASVRHAKVHAADVDDDSAADEPGARRRRRDHFERELELGGPLDDDQRARLLEIAGRCPVHRTLEEGHVRVTTTLAAAEPDG